MILLSAISEMISLDFMRNAFIAGFLVSIACGIMGSYVVVNRLAGLSGGIAHASYGGIGLACFFGFSPMFGALGFSLACALLMGWLTWKNRERADTLICVIWAFGMAMGVILTDLTPGYSGDLLSFLFGSILTVPASLLYWMGGLTLAILICTGIYFPQFLALSHDPEFARVRGIPVLRLYMLLITLITFTVVMAVQAVGLILVIALLTIPAYIAESHAKNLRNMMCIACAVSLALTLGGTAVAYFLNLTVGPVIILLGVALYVMNRLLTLRRR